MLELAESFTDVGQQLYLWKLLVKDSKIRSTIKRLQEANRKAETPALDANFVAELEGNATKP